MSVNPLTPKFSILWEYDVYFLYMIGDAHTQTNILNKDSIIIKIIVKMNQ